MDLETPNSHQSSICQVGALLVDTNMNIIEEYNELIDPEDGFEEQNVRVHGITSAQVLGCSNFPRYYKEVLGSLLNGAVFINHNPLFDLTVLNKAISNYDLPFPNIKTVYDTIEMAKSFFPYMPNYKLDTLCNRNHIFLQHHDALSDAKAAYELFKIMKSDSDALTRGNLPWTWQEYGLAKRATSTNLEQSLFELYGLIIGISLNDAVSNDEVNELKVWLQQHACYRNTPIFEEVLPIIFSAVMQDSFTIVDCECLLQILSCYMKKGRLSDKSQAENVLKGIMRGITADNTIDAKEITGLIIRSNSYSDLKLDKAYEMILDELNKRILDGSIFSEEQNDFIKHCKLLINPTCDSAATNDNICLESLKGKVVVITGEFRRGTRKEIKDELETLGITVAKCVTKKTNYVIQGSLGSESYALGNYGIKVKKAIAYGIHVLSEDVLFGD